MTPRWKARFGKPLLNQTIALVQRDQAHALAIVNADREALGNHDLQPFFEFHKGAIAKTAFPWLIFEHVLGGFVQESPDTREQPIRLNLHCHTGQFDNELAQDDAADYACALDMILTSAPLTDWCLSLPIDHETVPSGMTQPNAFATVTEMFVESHRYDSVSVPELNVPVLRVTLGLLFHLEET